MKNFQFYTHQCNAKRKEQKLENIPNTKGIQNSNLADRNEKKIMLAKGQK